MATTKIYLNIIYEYKYEIRLRFDKPFLYIIQNTTVVINKYTHAYIALYYIHKYIASTNKLQRVSSVHEISKVYWKRFLYFTFTVHCEQFAILYHFKL